MDSVGTFLKNLLVSAAMVLGLTPTPSPAPPIPRQNVAPAPSALSPPADLYRTSGSYQLLGHSIEYQVAVPKHGGPITGSFSGACSGTIQGTYSGGAAGVISGTAEGACKAGPINQNISGKYDGKVDVKDGTVDLTYQAHMGLLSSHGSHLLRFAPPP